MQNNASWCASCARDQSLLFSCQCEPRECRIVSVWNQTAVSAVNRVEVRCVCTEFTWLEAQVRVCLSCVDAVVTRPVTITVSDVVVFFERERNNEVTAVIVEVTTVDRVEGEVVRITVSRRTNTAVYFEAFIVVFEDEVHNTGYSVSTVDSGRATGCHFHTLNERTWNRTDVDSLRTTETRNVAATVYKCQRTFTAETTKVQRVSPGR